MSKHICGNEAYAKLKHKKKLEQFLQETVINLDWCYYYSSNFGGEIPGQLAAKFDHVLSHALKVLAPLFIYVLGKPFEANNWVQTRTDINLDAPLRTDIPVAGKLRRLYLGRFPRTEGAPAIPTFYLDFGAAQVSDKAAAAIINQEFVTNIPGLTDWLSQKVSRCLIN